jgi:hypothetical protein
MQDQLHGGEPAFRCSSSVNWLRNYPPLTKPESSLPRSQQPTKRIHSRHSHSISPKTRLEFNVTALFTPKSPKRPLRPKFSSWNFVFIYHFLHACYTSHPNHFPCSDHPNNIYWRVQTQEAHLCAILSIPRCWFSLKNALNLRIEVSDSCKTTGKILLQDWSYSELSDIRSTWVKLDRKSV